MTDPTLESYVADHPYMNDLTKRQILAAVNRMRATGQRVTIRKLFASDKGFDPCVDGLGCTWRQLAEYGLNECGIDQ